MKGQKTGGRQKGSKNKSKEWLNREIKASGLMPLDYMLEVMRDKNAEPERRDDMAKSAAPYLHAKRVPEDKGGQPQTYVLITNVDPNDA